MTKEFKQALENAVKDIDNRYCQSQEVYTPLERKYETDGKLSTKEQVTASFEEGYSKGLLDAILYLRRHLNPLGFLNPLDQFSDPE